MQCRLVAGVHVASADLITSMACHFAIRSAWEGMGVCAVDVGAGWRCCCPGPRLRCVTMHLGRNLGKGVLSVLRGPVRQGTPSSWMMECMQPKREESCTRTG